MADRDDDLLQELASMRNTLANFTQLIKKQNEKIKELEAKTAHLEPVTAEQLLIDRFTASSMRNRNLDADPRTIAYTAHLYHIKQVPAIRINMYGLLSQSKMQGLSKWEKQHLLDFCELNGVSDVYKNGLPDDEVKELVSDWVGFKEYLANRNDKPVKLTKLERAIKRVNEQTA